MIPSTHCSLTHAAHAAVSNFRGRIGRRSAIAVLSLVAMTGAGAQSTEEIRLDQDQFANLGIQTSALVPAEAVAGGRLPARVVIPPSQVRVVSAPQTGLVEALRAAVGEEVRAGQPLARVQSPELLALQRDFLQALTQDQLTRADLTRDRALFKEGIIAQRRLLEKKAAFAQAQALLDERRQSLLLAGMGDKEVQALARSRRLDSALEVPAPVAGVVLERMAVVGQRVDRAEPLYRLARLDPLWLEIRAPLDSLAGLGVGQDVEVVGGAAGGAARGRLILIGRDVESANQTVLLRAEVTNGVASLRPGQFVEVRLQSSARANQYRVPGNALVRSGNQTFLFVRTPAGFRAASVRVLAQQGGEAVVQGELKGDETIASAGLATLKAAWLGVGGGE